MRKLLRGYSRPWLAIVLFLAALGIALLRVIGLSHGFGLRLSADWAMVDFRVVVYYPVRAFLEGVNPYDRASYLALYPALESYPPYLPAALLLHLPFGLLSVGAGELCYAALTVALTTFLAYVSLKFNNVKASSTNVLLVAALIVLSRPGQWNLLLGQVTLQAVLASYAALHYAHRSPLVSGIGLAVTTFKPSFGLPLAVLMLVRRDRRAVVIGVALSALANLPPLVILVQHAGGVRQFYESAMSSHRAWTGNPDVDPVTSVYRIDTAALIGRLVGHPLDGLAQSLVVLAVLGLAALALRRIERTDPGHGTGMSSNIICLAMLLSVYHMPYDLLLLTLPLVALAYRRMPLAAHSSHLRWLLLGLFGILAVNYASTHAVMDQMRTGSAAWLLLASLNGMALLVVFSMYVGTALGLGGRVARLGDTPLAVNR